MRVCFALLYYDSGLVDPDPRPYLAAFPPCDTTTSLAGLVTR